jgi:hypothetical protein
MRKPSVHFTQELFNEICAQLAQGRSLREIERMENMPLAGTVCNWVETNAELKKQYASAREIGYILMAEDVIDIADNSAVAAGAPDPRLRVETRKWLLSKVLPKIYGDKQTVDGKFTVDWAVVAQEAADKYKQKHEHES